MVPFTLQCFALTILTCSETRLYGPSLAFYPVKQLMISTVDSLATGNVPADELLILNTFIVCLPPWKRIHLEQAGRE